MKGHIRKRGKNSWAIVVELDRDPATGRRKQHWQTIRGTKRDAEHRLRELLHDLDRGGWVKPTKLTMAQFLNKWLHEYAAVSVRPRTLERYQSIVKHHLVPELGSILITQLQPSHIQACHARALQHGRLDGKLGGLSPRTVAQHHRVLRQALSHAVKWGLAVRNVAEAIDPPRWTAREMRTLDFEGVRIVLQEVENTIYHPIFHLAIYTGMRRSELLALRWKHVDLDMAVLHVVQVLHRLRGGQVISQEPKTRRSRRPIALSPDAALSLRKHRERQRAECARLDIKVDGESFVFANPDGSPLLPDTISHAFMKICRRVGIRGIRFHDLRHTHATLMLQQGVHPKVVSERLGHSSVAITLDVYSHLSPDIQAAAARRFDEGLRAQELTSLGVGEGLHK